MDSLDSVLMLYAYAQLGRDSEEGKLALFFHPKGLIVSGTTEESEEVTVAREGNGPVLLSTNTEIDPVEDDPAKSTYKTSRLHNPTHRTRLRALLRAPAVSRILRKSFTGPAACSTPKPAP